MLLGGVVAGLLVLFGVGLLMTRERRSEIASRPAPPTGAHQIMAGDATFVGRAACSTCHREQEQLWRGSHHDLAMQVTDVPAERLDVEQRAAFDRAAAEYVETQRYNADRAEARANLGTFYAHRGDAAGAEQALQAAIRLEPLFAPAYVNLADLYRARGRDADAERILRQGLHRSPQSAVLHHALGLALVRVQRIDVALVELGRAAALEPDNVRFAYVYAVALHSTGRAREAIARLEEALAAHPNDRDILEALASFHHARGEDIAAKKYADRLRALSAED